MNRYIISYASNGYYECQKRFTNSIVNEDVDVLSYTDKWLRKQKFYKENKFILDQKRGGGYWLWKPFILLETFKKMKVDDMVLYADVDSVALQSLEYLFKIGESEDIILFDNSNHLNRVWTKRDCFVLMNADSEIYYNGMQVMGGFIFLKKSNKSQKFLEDWLSFSLDYRILTDSENELGLQNLPEFVEHRHDQSILSILKIKWSLPLFRDPTQYGNFRKMIEFRIQNEYLEQGEYAQDDDIKYNSPYGTLFELIDSIIEKNNLLTRICNRIIHITSRFYKKISIKYDKA